MKRFAMNTLQFNILLISLFLLLFQMVIAQQSGMKIPKKDYRAIEESIAPNVVKEIANYSLFEKQTKYLARADEFSSSIPFFQREKIHTALMELSFKKANFDEKEHIGKFNQLPSEIMLGKETISLQSKKYLPAKQKAFFE